MKKEKIHIGSLIKQKLSERSLTIAEFAKLIYCDRTTVYDIFKRKSIDVDRLLLISEILGYNFLWEVYLKDNPIMAYSTGGALKVEINGDATHILESTDYVNICFHVVK